jgi:hypothetical protein
MAHTSLSFRQNSFGDIAAAFAPAQLLLVEMLVARGRSTWIEQPGQPVDLIRDCSVRLQSSWAPPIS